MENQLLNKLNKEQKKAVEIVEGPVMAVAGAGSGKTSVLTNRIAYLIQEAGVSPYNILAITFTNKAANEMKERVQKLIDLPMDNIWISTFHSMGAHFLRREIDSLDYDKNFQIVDDQDTLNIIKNLMKKHNYDLNTYSPTIISKLVGNLKAKLVSINHIDQPIRSMIEQLYPLYNAYLKDNNLVDFEDLLVLTLKILQDFSGILKRYQEKFQYILVDEFQDTNNLQYNIIYQLAKEHRNIFIVGDEDQSIYAFRGSNVGNIKKFAKDFPEHKKIILNQNYRSKDTILKAANSVIKNNKDRIPKDLFSNLGSGDKIIHYKANTDEEEAYYVYEQIRKLRRENTPLSEIVVLYRNNAMSRRFEDIFLKYNLPHKVVGNLSFYKRKEIKDIIAYLHLLINSGDDYSFSRVYNTPKRGVGNVSFANLVEYAEENHLKLFDCIGVNHSPLSGKAALEMTKFRDLITELKQGLETRTLLDTYDLLLDKSGYKEMLEKDDSTKDKTFQSERKLDNLEEFKTIILEKVSDYERDISNYDKLATLLNDLVLHVEAEDNEEHEAVSLMTFHSAKGLEFDIVFMTCLEQSLFPAIRNGFDAANNIDEERRLFYVGLTRARHQVYLTNCKTRFMYGRYMDNLDSQFIDEIDEDYLDKRGSNHVRKSSFERVHSSKNRPTVKYASYDTEEKQIKVSDKVNHKVFGRGMVVEVKGDLVKIAFSVPHGVKTLMKDHPSFKVED
ncbi:UvrD-helicase domain-containing protein [Hujiaoplasma nucleasis]|uniref:DNA 3'-5' helicase n=1 Tax=Hujiaoplasma nucleasis TaxID=2725268 RepID=A0A7L6N4L3_9MOLU|nr:UvrD-helicase domain-containing protein [Hujiaoplasma nucleasis]QLY40501.1 UvrD-helicase domain-containing protein [Hujiaoplasma nucleasis]